MTIQEMYDGWLELKEVENRLYLERQKCMDDLIALGKMKKYKIDCPVDFQKINDEWYESTKVVSQQESDIIDTLGDKFYKLKTGEVLFAQWSDGATKPYGLGVADEYRD